MALHWVRLQAWFGPGHQSRDTVWELVTAQTKAELKRKIQQAVECIFPDVHNGCIVKTRVMKPPTLVLMKKLRKAELNISRAFWQLQQLLKATPKLKRRKLVYVAAPYNGTDEEIEQRMDVALEFMADLQSKGMFVVSPLLAHFMIPYGAPSSQDDYWYDYSRRLLGSGVEHMYVLKLPGWDKSKGIQIEIETCKKFEIPVAYITPGRRKPCGSSSRKR